MSYQPANILKRIAAVIIDHLLVNFLLYLLTFRILDFKPEDFSLTTNLYLIFFTVNFLYFFILEGLLGKTIGKKVFNLEVRQVSGAKIKIFDAFIRNLIRPIDLIGFYLIGIIFVSTSSKSQRLGDMLARTYVVESR